MPAVRAGAFVTAPAREGMETIRLTAEANGELHTWFSARYVCLPKRVIRFVRLDPDPPLLRMEGFWRFSAESGGTRVTLQHSFSVADPGAAEFFAQACRRNAEGDLAGLETLFSQSTPDITTGGASDE